MKLTKEEGRSIVYDDHEDWTKIEETTEGTGRWSIHYSGVFRYKCNGKYYCLTWSVGATEGQDERPFDYEDPELREVKQVEKTVKVWEFV